MKKSQYIILGTLIGIILCSLINIFITGFLSNYIIIAILFGLITVLYFTIGFNKNKQVLNKDIILTIVILCVAYYLIIYAIGFFIGFYRNFYSNEIVQIIKNIVPVILTICLSEILRYMINSRLDKKITLIILSLLAFTLLDNTLIIRSLIENNIAAAKIMDYIGLIILPSLTTNILLTYLSVKYSFKNTIVYRLIMEIPVYIIPIYPNFGTYIEAIIKTILPIIIFFRIYKMIEKKKIKKIVIIKRNKANKLSIAGLAIFTIILVYLVSGFFRYQALVIATGSMRPNINIGDVVIVKKLKDNEIKELKIGDILVYKHESKIICHRIVRILKTGKFIYFETKGDNNKSEDYYLIPNEDVIGTTSSKIRFIGYPSVLLNELLNRN